MKMSYEEAHAIIKTLPYVKEIIILPAWCNGWSNIDGRRKPCKEKGRWHFTKSPTKGKGRHVSGYFCTYHLIESCLNYSIYEKARAQRAYDKATKVM